MQTTDALVAKQYQLFPYPSYPLNAQIEPEQSYLGWPGFAARVARISRAATNKVAVLGSGDTAPAPLIASDPSRSKWICVDQSKRSLQRLRFRLWRTPRRKFQLVQQDIDDFLDDSIQKRATFDHVDVYGVLHHLSDPLTTLKKLHGVLSAQGTIRVMVYNSPARSWIHQIQDRLKQRKLGFENRQHLKQIRSLLQELSTDESYAEKLSAWGLHNKVSNAKLVDTFLHARELRINPSEWFAMFRSAGFHVSGLFDRYHELTNLPNQLWSFDEAAVVKACQGEMLGNLELYLSKGTLDDEKAAFHPGKKPDLKRCIQNYPSQWDSIRAPFTLKLKLWWLWQDFSSSIIPSTLYASEVELFMHRQSQKTVNQFARIGAIIPSSDFSTSFRSSCEFRL